MIELTVFGHCWSMKNGRRKLWNGKIIMHPKAYKFAEDFALWIRPEDHLFLGSRKQLLRSFVHVYYPSWRQDLDCSLVYDLLEKHGIVSNDRWIREKRELATVTKLEPKVYIKIEEM